MTTFDWCTPILFENIWRAIRDSLGYYPFDVVAESQGMPSHMSAAGDERPSQLSLFKLSKLTHILCQEDAANRGELVNHCYNQ